MNWQLVSTFEVLGEPKGQPRPRAFVNKRTGHASVYDNGTAEGWKSLVALSAKNHLPSEPLNEPIRVSAIFFFPRPNRLMRKKDPQGPIPHTAKPDGDNVMKAVLDCLSQIGMWRDDALVCSQEIEKYYTSKDRTAGARIQIFVQGGIES